MGVVTKFKTRMTPQALEQAKQSAIFNTSLQALKDINQYVPREYGTLISGSYVNSDPKNGLLRWAQKYARYLFYGFVMVDPVTHSPWARRGVSKVLTNRRIKFRGAPKRGALWTRRAEADHRKQWLTILANFYRRAIG